MHKSQWGDVGNISENAMQHCLHDCGLRHACVLCLSSGQPDRVSTRPPLGGTVQEREALEGRLVTASAHWEVWGNSST